MYEEDFIFGPLTWKQFIYVGGASGVAVVALLQLPGLLGVIIAVAVFGVGIKCAIDNQQQKIELDQLEVFLNEKKVLLGEQKFKSWLKQMIAEKSSYQSILRERGVEPDVDLKLAINKLKERYVVEVGVESKET